MVAQRSACCGPFTAWLGRFPTHSCHVMKQMLSLTARVQFRDWVLLAVYDNMVIKSAILDRFFSDTGVTVQLGGSPRHFVHQRQQAGCRQRRELGSLLEAFTRIRTLG